MSAPPLGVDLIRAERERQITDEGYTPAHDRVHDVIDLLKAAIAYTGPDHAVYWPWDWETFKPEAHQVETPAGTLVPHHGTVRDLTKAGALIAAAIDRLQAQCPGCGELTHITANGIRIQNHNDGCPEAGL